MLKIKYFSFLLFIIFSQSFLAQITIIDENFNSGTLPAGWSNVNNGGTAGQVWEFTPTSNGTITAGNISGNYAILDSDAYGNGNNQNATLITPLFSAASYESIFLEFDYQYRHYNGGESCVIEVYNGTSWIEVFRKEFGDQNYVNLTTGADLETIDITTAANGASNAQVRFTYIGVWDYWWAIDNVKVIGQNVPVNTAYLGPGGVGGVDGTSDLILWTNPDNITESDGSAFSEWSDLSGYNSDLTQSNATFQPIVRKNIVNDYDVVRFETGNRRLRKINFTNFPTTAISGFYVNKTSDSNDGVLSYASSANNNNFLLFNSNNIGFYRNSNISSGIDANNNEWNIVGFRWRRAGGTATVSLNGNSGFTGTIANGNSITAGGSLALAGEQDSVDGNYDAAQSHQGDFSEVILFNSYISEAQRIIVSNYLSAKYNIALSANDFYDEDTSGGNFDFDVAGIGQATDGSNHTDSQGTGIVRMYNPSDLTNDEFLFWGRDNKDAQTFSTNTNNYKERISTKWRVSKRNDVGNVSFVIDLSSVDLSSKQSCAPLNLVIDNNSDLLTPTTTYELTDIGGGLYKANNVVFSDNDYFTIEYQDLIVVDGTQFYNGSGAANVPNTFDACYKLLVKNTATGTLTLTENAEVREVEIETGGKLVLNSGIYLKPTNNILLNGEIRLTGTSQLLQEHTGASTISGTGKLYVDQNSDVTSLYLYNYFSSPVVTVGQSTYTVASVMKDGTTVTSASSNPPSISFISGLDGSFASSPIEIANRWIYTYDDVGAGTYAYYNNGGVGSTQTIAPGKGYLFKGPGRAQNYTFVGTPNDGEYSYSGIPSGVNILIGNPYPSAFNIQKFLTDNFSIGTTAYLWQQVGVANSIDIKGHYSSGYIGGYATINSSTSTEATALTESNFVLEAENSTLGGNAAIVGDKVALTTATDSIKFKFNGLSKSVDSLFIVYSADASKNIDIDVNNISMLTSVNLPSTSGILDTLKVELSIMPIDSVLLKSKDANTSSIDKVFGKQKFSYTAPPFNYLTIGQGFFFNTDTPGTMVFNNSQRAFIPEGTGGSFFFKEQKKNNDLPVIKLGMDYHPSPTETYHRQLAVSFKQGNSFDYDRGFDSEMSERGVTDFYWKFLNDDKYYVIAGVQEIDEDLEVPLEVIINESQEIEIKIDELQNINRPIYLKDAATNTSYNLNNSNAKIQLETGLYSNRFYLAFKESSLTIKDEFLTNDFIIQHYRDSKKLLIKNNGNSSINKVILYNVLGQKIIEVDDAFQLNRKEISIKTNSLSSAIYIVTIKTSEGIISKKFF